MARERLIAAAGDYRRSFLTQDGAHYRREHQELGPAMKRVQNIRDMHDYATKSSNPNEWRHVGSIPMTVLIDWLTENRFTMDQWARNDGCVPGKTYPQSRSGVKDKFLAYFMSRDFSKLHNAHMTTKRGSSQIVVPTFIGGKDRGDLRGTQD